jgi:hypothetical protein
MSPAPPPLLQQFHNEIRVSRFAQFQEGLRLFIYFLHVRRSTSTSAIVLRRIGSGISPKEGHSSMDTAALKFFL